MASSTAWRESSLSGEAATAASSVLYAARASPFGHDGDLLQQIVGRFDLKITQAALIRKRAFQQAHDLRYVSGRSA